MMLPMRNWILFMVIMRFVIMMEIWMSGKVIVLCFRPKTSFCQSFRVVSSCLSGTRSSLLFFVFSVQASGVVLKPGQTFSTQGQTENGKHMSKYSEEVVSPCLSHHRPQSGESWNELNKNGENIFSHFLNANTNQKTWPNPDKKKWLRAGLCVWENPHTGTYDRRSFHTGLVYGIRSNQISVHGLHNTFVVTYVLFSTILFLNGLSFLLLPWLKILLMWLQIYGTFMSEK